jgi:hypothetical protein
MTKKNGGIRHGASVETSTQKTQIADGSLLPNLQMLVIERCEVATLIAALFARHRSPDHSTIGGVGLYMGSHLRKRYVHDGARSVVQVLFDIQALTD